VKGKRLKVAGIIGIALIGTIMLVGYVYGYVYAGRKWNSNPTYYFYEGFTNWIGHFVPEEIEIRAEEYAKKGAEAWNDVSDCDFELKYGGKTWRWGGYYDGVNTIDAWILTAGTGAGTGSRGADAAITWNWFSGSQILETDTNFDYRLKWAAADSCPTDRYDIQSTAAHEFGHWLCLRDLYSTYTDTEKTMYGYIEMGETKKRSLDQDDIDGIKSIYPKSPPVCGGGGGGCMNPEMGLELSEKDVSILEKFREKLALSKAPEGSIGGSYYQFTQEIEALLRMNPKLRKQTKELISHFIPKIEAVIDGENREILDKNDMELLVSWIDEASKYGSPELQKMAIHIKRMIKEGKEFGFKEFLLSPNLSVTLPEDSPEPETIKLQTRLLSIHPDSDEIGYYIPFELAETAEVTIKLYNIVGQQVKVLNPGSLEPGRYERKVIWNKTNNQGSKVSKGLYFCQFQAGKVSQTGRILIAK